MISADDARHVRSRALAILREGRARLLTVSSDIDGHPLLIDAIVYGHSGEHLVGFTAGHYRCTCRGVRVANLCPHIMAVEFVAHAALPHGTSEHPKIPARRVKT